MVIGEYITFERYSADEGVALPWNILRGFVIGRSSVKSAFSLTDKAPDEPN